VRPALDNFYKALSDEQKARFNMLGRQGPRMAQGDWRQRWQHHGQHFGNADRQGWGRDDGRRGFQRWSDDRGRMDNNGEDRGRWQRRDNDGPGSRDGGRPDRDQRWQNRGDNDGRRMFQQRGANERDPLDGRGTDGNEKSSHSETPSEERL
jgi:hypothetical protein